MNENSLSYIRYALGLFGLRPARTFPFIRRATSYSLPIGPSNVLNPDFFSPVNLQTRGESEQLDGNSLYRVWTGIAGGHKWFHYFKAYQSALSCFNGKAIRMLEIGVYKGGSLKMWHEYLPRDSVVVGIDIDPSCRQFESPNDNLFVRVGDQSDPRFLHDVIREFGAFDFILDDGSHVCSHMIASFNYLYLDGLKAGGVYLAEDTHAAFWKTHRDQRYSFVDLAKDFVDFMHAHYWQHQAEVHFRQGHPQREKQLVVPRIATEIREIRFEDSMITIYKSVKPTLPISVHF